MKKRMWVRQRGRETHTQAEKEKPLRRDRERGREGKRE